jgi:hypothetical protein
LRLKHRRTVDRSDGAGRQVGVGRTTGQQQDAGKTQGYYSEHKFNPENQRRQISLPRCGKGSSIGSPAGDRFASKKNRSSDGYRSGFRSQSVLPSFMAAKGITIYQETEISIISSDRQNKIQKDSHPRPKRFADTPLQAQIGRAPA